MREIFNHDLRQRLSSSFHQMLHQSDVAFRNYNDFQK